MRVFDTFPFDGELDLLAHRLEQTYDRVDAFVIVEAAQTYSGARKELTFAAERRRFEWASDKLRHVRLDSLGGPHRSPLERAAMQRDAVRIALRDADPEDAVLLFDVDEIASRPFLERLRERGIDRPRRVLMTRLYEHADTVAPHSPCCPAPGLPFPAASPYARPATWEGLDAGWSSSSGVVVPFAALTTRTAFELRFGQIDAAPIPEGGRHFSSVDPSTRLARKLHRVFHTEWAGDRETSPVHLERCRDHGVHHRGWWYAERPGGDLPDDVERLLERLGAAPTDFPPLIRRRLVRTWAWLRLWSRFPEGFVSAVDRHFERLLPLLAPLLAAAGAARQAAASTTIRPRPAISRTNSPTSRAHVARSTS